MTPTDEKPMTVEALMKNMRLAWYLGQRYWQQADSESYADNKRSALTLEKFNKLLESSRAAIEQYGRERVAAALEAELDALAKMCEDKASIMSPGIDARSLTWAEAAQYCAATIRARLSPIDDAFYAGFDKQTLKISRPWPPDATYRVHELMAQLAQKELECQRLREAAYLPLIRDDFERRMKARGHGSVAMSRLSGGEYMSPAVEREWESEKRKHSPLRAPTHPERGLTP